MPESGDPDVAARVAAINAEHQAALDRIEADYELTVSVWDHPERLPLVYGARGVAPLSRRAATEKRDRLRGEVEQRRRSQLETLDLELRLLVGRTSGGLSKRSPIAIRVLTEAVRLLAVEQASQRAVARATGLTTRRVGYVADALTHGDLTWDERNGCLGALPNQWNTPDGVRLPVRENTRP